MTEHHIRTCDTTLVHELEVKGTFWVPLCCEHTFAKQYLCILVILRLCYIIHSVIKSLDFFYLKTVQSLS